MSDLFKDLKNSSNLITGHINPDGDALGSALAFKLILDSKGVESDVSFDMKGNVPSNLNHLPIDLILDSPKKIMKTFMFLIVETQKGLGI